MMKNIQLALFCLLCQQVSAQNRPDLTITNLTITNPTVLQGQVLNYKFDLKNIGIANASAAFKVKAYISRDNLLSYDDIQDGVVSTSNFNAGFTSFQVPGASTMRNPIIAGAYYLILKADADNQVIESNENNNIISSTLFQVTNNCRHQDSLQLVNLYNATNGSAWTNKWNLNTPIHTWFGIALTAEGCVKDIDLYGNNLSGTIPNLNMPNLDQLFLSANALTGSIPAFNLPLLQGLGLGQNQLTGSIPNLNCPNLKGFYVPYNQLSGSIPNLNCPMMVFIDLSNNPLTGSIPNFNFPELTGIILNFTQVSGKLPNFNFPKLTLLHLNNNQLTGSIPNFNLPLVQNVFLQNNRFTGNIPAFQLPNANPILLDNNQLTGSIPDFNVPANAFIRLSSNQLSGCIPLSLKKFCNGAVEMTNNPGLDNQDFTTFCTANVGACTTTSTNYCASKGSIPWNEWIAGVQFSNINNPNIKQGYADFTGATANVLRGASYAFTLTQGYSWATDPSNATAQWRVWIDYNKNNVFDVNELVASGSRNTSTVAIAIPTTASLGKTRMRVSFKKTGAPTACEVFEKGEVEDYSVYIRSNTALTGQAVANTNRLNAMLYEQKVKLDWMHWSDKAASFEIQKPTEDGSDFKTIHRTTAKPTNNYYIGYDEVPVEGVNDYRLKTVLKDNSIQYSPIQRIDYQKLANFTLFPNPTSDEAFLDLKDFENRTVDITISDVAGQILLNQTIEKAPVLPYRLEVSTLKNGVYSVQIQTAGKRSVTRQLYILN